MTGSFEPLRRVATAPVAAQTSAQSLMLLSAVLREKAAGTKLEEVITPLENAIGALNGMLTGLLELSRLDAGIIRPKPAEVDIPKLLSRVGTDYELQATQQGLRFRLRCVADGAFPTDPELLERIVRNLLDNAFKYTERGFVTLICFRRGPGLIIQVCDSGHGIAPEHLKVIFEEFFQVGNEERDRARGLGIGLSIVQRSVHMLGGRIRVWSRLGRGSLFTVMLPPMAMP